MTFMKEYIIKMMEEISGGVEIWIGDRRKPGTYGTVSKNNKQIKLNFFHHFLNLVAFSYNAV